PGARSTGGTSASVGALGSATLGSLRSRWLWLAILSFCLWYFVRYIVKGRLGVMRSCLHVSNAISRGGAAVSLYSLSGARVFAPRFFGSAPVFVEYLLVSALSVLPFSVFAHEFPPCAYLSAESPSSFARSAA